MTGKAIISSVTGDDRGITRLLNKCFPIVIRMDHNTPLPVKSMYKTKETLGNDRIAGVTGANALFPSTNVLVIDAGTAITYDLITRDSVYRGGNITPGLSMRFKALHTYTGKLPLAEKTEHYPLIGEDTISAIVAGVTGGILMEIEGHINALKKVYTDLKAIITGGDAEFFDKKLKNTIFVVPNLISIGLNTILEYNVKTT